MVIKPYMPGDDANFLKALALVESGNDAKAKGLRGEIGRYQIMPRYYYRFHQDEHSVARWLLNDNAVRLHRSGLTTDEYANIVGVHYALWNFGYTNCRRYKFKVHKMPASVQERVKNFTAVYLNINNK